MIGDLHFHRGYSLRLQESKPLKNNGIISIRIGIHTGLVVVGEMGGAGADHQARVSASPPAFGGDHALRLIMP